MSIRNKYSFFSIAKNALTHHENWQKAWKNPEPKKIMKQLLLVEEGMA